MSTVLCWKCGQEGAPHTYKKDGRTYEARYCATCHAAELRVRNLDRQRERLSQRTNGEGRHLGAKEQGARLDHCRICGKKRSSYNLHKTLCFTCEEQQTDARLKKTQA